MMNDAIGFLLDMFAHPAFWLGGLIVSLWLYKGAH